MRPVVLGKALHDATMIPKNSSLDQKHVELAGVELWLSQSGMDSIRVVLTAKLKA
jgi:hypothetical protein